MAKLQGFGIEDDGIEADASRIFTSSTVTADYLLQRYGFGAPVHIVGMDGLTVTLAEAGFAIFQDEALPDHRVVAVAAGMDRAITHDKLKVAMRLIREGAEFVATTAMAGDQLETDILGAQQLGITGVAVLTGVVTREHLAESQIQPDLVCDSIAEFSAALLAA